MATDIKQIKLMDLIPSSIANDEQVKAAAQALDLELQAVTAVIKETMLISRLDELPETVIDLLAWQWHVDFYEPNLAIEKKRDLVRQSIAWHKRKGTPSVVQEMVSSVFADGKVYEWFEYGGDPFKFRVETTDNIQDGGAYERLIKLINAVKNARSWLESIRVNKSSSQNFFIGGAQFVGVTMTINPTKLNLQQVNSNVYIAGAQRIATYITIGPEVS